VEQNSRHMATSSYCAVSQIENILNPWWSKLLL